MEMEILLALAAALTAVGTLLGVRRYRRTRSTPTLPSSASSPVETIPQPPAPQRASLGERLAQTRTQLSKGLGAFFGKTASFSEAEWETVEEGLLAADVGMKTVQYLLDKVREGAKSQPDASLKSLLRKACEETLQEGDAGLIPHASPHVIMIVGVNGVGKTTTVGKLAQRYASEGKQVLLGAADTFRAGAISQLKVWADRAQVAFVAGKEGGDPGAVAFDALSATKARSMDLLLLDTAGRLHTKVNLMDELKKVQRVLKKVVPEAPHETWLVVDGTLGQNSVRQAQEFHNALGVTGFIVTKLDGTAKGGTILSLVHEFQLPIKYIGIGETAEDLVPFNPSEFISAILG